MQVGEDFIIYLVETFEEFNEMYDFAKNSDVIIFDTETEGLYSFELFTKALQLEKTIPVLRDKVDFLEQRSLAYKSKTRIGSKKEPLQEAYDQLTGLPVKLAAKASYFVTPLRKKLKRIESQILDLRSEAQEHPGGLHFWENQLGCIQIGVPSTINEGEIHCFLIRPDIAEPYYLDKLLNGCKVLIGQNIQFDWRMIKQHKGINLHCNNLFDTMIAEYNLKNGYPVKFSMKEISSRRLGIEVDKDKATRVSHWCGEWTPDMVHYAALDVVYPYHIWLQQKAELELDPELLNVNKYDCLLVPHLAQMEMNGLGIDIEKARQLLSEYSAKRSESLALCVELLSIDPNLDEKAQRKLINSHLTLRNLLKDKGIEVMATNEKVLGEIGGPIVEAILDYRGHNKLITTYLSPFVEQSAPVNGHYRLYGCFNMTRTRTRRLSSDDPNLQNLPSTQEFRGIVHAPEGRCIIQGDLSSIEPRIIAHASSDPAMCRWFNEGKDPYKAIGSLLLGIGYDDVTKEQRKELKAVVLSVAYDKSAWGLAKELEIDEQSASYLLNKVFSIVYGVRKWSQYRKELAKKEGFVRTIAGGLRYLPDLYADDPKKRSKAEREIVNTYVQGSAAELMRGSIRALGHVTNEMKQYKPIATVHDELLMEAPDTEEGRTLGQRLVKFALVDTTQRIITRVPITVGDMNEPLVIYNWGEAK